MQLFICEYQVKGNEIVSYDTRVIEQLQRVLRAKQGYICYMQSQGVRHEVRILEVHKEGLKAEIIATHTQLSFEQRNIGMLIALPNKWDKAELIVQKCAEIGIKNIVRWASERSVLKEWKSEKIKRMQTIILEAVEQSRGRHLPEVSFLSGIQEWIVGKQCVVFDTVECIPSSHQILKSQEIWGIIGPEGGFSEKERIFFKMHGCGEQTLGNHILRMETAAIVGSWWLQQGIFPGLEKS